MAFPIRPHKLFLSGERSGCEVLLQTPFSPSFRLALGVSAIGEVKVDHSTLFQCHHSFSLQLLSCSYKDRVVSSQSPRNTRAPYPYHFVWCFQMKGRARVVAQRVRGCRKQ